MSTTDSVLIDSGENDGIIANYHPAMSAEGKAWLSVKFYMVLRNYAQNCHFLVKKWKIVDFETLGYTIEELDLMHEFFQE